MAVVHATGIMHHLAEPVPIYLVYMTSWVTPNGIVHFRRDVYGADESAVSLATN